MKKIIIVDDHPMIRRTLSALIREDPELELIGESGDGEEGLKMVLSENPDLLILDLELPNLDGLSMIRRIRLVNNKMRILILSAKSEQLMAGHTHLAGANGYVGKGREMGELVTAIKTVLFGYDCFPAAPMNVPGKAARLEALSPREVEVLQYLARGVNNRDIAVRLFLSEKTVSTYKTRIQEKLGLESLAGMIEYAVLHKLID
ncbi:response regulator transcription factor [Paraburkholderia bonniea]|uniref:response regulator transcription factor n=1 Tax=Paraburkholderia bonniea TaxID=2152891 RepID=UPI0012929D9D|nr:response regulator transcription factor [Paraburkholderia bonniea]WJF91754.1 response regulator transcription factor [Paraburkholderia bonniea]WJF95074.1 response regulator transcription factor [Paraburkholderia bonniea]